MKDNKKSVTLTLNTKKGFNKNKHHVKNKFYKYERVKQLPNVTFSKFSISQSSCSYPWYKNRYEGMEKGVFKIER